MSYATMRDVLFALELTDSEPRDRLKVEPDLPEERSEPPLPAGSRQRSNCVAPRSPGQGHIENKFLFGDKQRRPASVHVNQQVHLDLLPIQLTPPRKGRLFVWRTEKRKQMRVPLPAA